MLLVFYNLRTNILNFIGNIGRFCFFCAYCVKTAVTGFDTREFIYITNFITIRSIFVVWITVFFSGVVVGLHSISSFSVKSGEIMAKLLTKSIISELGPVLAGITIAGRCGSFLAARIAYMKNSEQLSALHIFGIDHFKVYIVPSILGAFVSMMIVVVVSYVAGLIGGSLAVSHQLGQGLVSYLYCILHNINSIDIVHGLIKGGVFGIILATISCYCGIVSSYSAIGIGFAATKAVTWASVIIMLSDWILTLIFV